MQTGPAELRLLNLKDLRDFYFQDSSTTFACHSKGIIDLSMPNTTYRFFVDLLTTCVVYRYMHAVDVIAMMR
jgi:hypothetical protein